MRHRRDMRNLDASARLSHVLTSHELRSGIFLLPIKSTIKITNQMPNHLLEKDDKYGRSYDTDDIIVHHLL